jgi:hypothetical protein
MERRDRLRWAYAAGGAIATWFRDIRLARRCPRVFLVNSDTGERASRLSEACPNCICERVTVGRHGSPSPVRSSEILHSVLIAPADLENDQIAITVITHAEKNGMSVLRDGASNEEFRQTINIRRQDNANRHFHGVASIRCAEVRALNLPPNANDPLRRERLYCVFDTDLEGRPHHADIFATMHPNAQASKLARKAMRGRILEQLT